MNARRHVNRHIRRLTLGALLLSLSGWAQALDAQPFSAQALSQAQREGRAVALHFHADWCPVCGAQQRALKGLDLKSLTLLTVDYDRAIDLKRQHRVRAQSTLLVFKGDKETARLVGDTEADVLRKALQSAL